MSSLSRVASESRQYDRVLFLMRHGHAEDAPGIDFDRELTAAGREAVGRTCAWLSKCDVHPTHIIASPLVRATQTAVLVKDHLALKSTIVTWDEIGPGGQCSHVAAKLEHEDGMALLVTHQPFVGRFIEYLTGKLIAMDTAKIASIRTVSFEQSCGDVEWVSKD